MQISIIDHGPLKAKVSITVDGESIAFPEGSYHKLVDLMAALDAEPSGSAFKGKSHWVLNTDTVRMAQVNIGLRAEVACLEQSKDRINTLEKLLAGAVTERRALYDAPWWRRIWWAFQRKAR